MTLALPSPTRIVGTWLSVGQGMLLNRWRAEPGQPLGNSRLCRPYERFVGNLGLVQHGFRSSWKLVDAERLFGLKEERVDVSRANVLGGVLLRLPPHDRVGREIEVGGLP